VRELPNNSNLTRAPRLLQYAIYLSHHAFPHGLLLWCWGHEVGKMDNLFSSDIALAVEVAFGVSRGLTFLLLFAGLR
jgi:hypothetical protein